MSGIICCKPGGHSGKSIYNKIKTSKDNNFEQKGWKIPDIFFKLAGVGMKSPSRRRDPGLPGPSRLLCGNVSTPLFADSFPQLQRNVIIKVNHPL